MRIPVLALVLALAAGLPAGVGAAPPAAAQDKPSKKGAAEQGPAEREFLEGYASDDAVKRAKALDRLAEAPEEVRLRHVAALVVPKETKERRADLVARAVEILGRLRDEPNCEKVALLSRTGAVDQRIVYVEALAYMPQSGAAHRTLAEHAKDRDTWIRAMAVYGLGEHRTVDALDTVLAALADRQWQVQSAALAALPRIQDREALRLRAVPKLIEYLEGSAGRQQNECADALKRILGKGLGKDPEAWRRFLAAGDAPAAPKDDGAKPAPDGASPYAEQPPTKPHFYGLEVTSTRVVIVLDISMSMNDAIEIDKDRLRRETSQRRAVTGADAPKPGEVADPEDVGYDIPWWRVKTKFDFAKYQTINLVAGLEPNQNFELILFSTTVKPWMGRLVPANQANKQKAIALLESIKFDDKTNTWGALAAAFEMSATNVRTGGPGAPDEIYLITDGQPSIGDITDPNQISDAVLQLAKVHQMRLNVIAIGLNLTFLRRMAVGTGGVYKFF